MKLQETAEGFHQENVSNNPGAGQFNVYKVGGLHHPVSLPSNRRDFYKISLITKGDGILSYSNKSIPVKGQAICFSNPMIPYSWESLSENPSGYFCLFKEGFINKSLKADSLSASPLFKVNGNHVLIPDEHKMVFLTGIYEQMITEIHSSYANKYELLRSYVQIIMHEALKIEPTAGLYHKSLSSSARISDLFMELLERQFPVASVYHTLHFRNANEFAGQLSVHTNHLNRALKEITGKTTTELISERILKEARALLMHSNWDVSEIGYCLGFEHAPNFNIFFKKQTGQTPNQFRRQFVAIS